MPSDCDSWSFTCRHIHSHTHTQQLNTIKEMQKKRKRQKVKEEGKRKAEGGRLRKRRCSNHSLVFSFPAVFILVNKSKLTLLSWHQLWVSTWVCVCVFVFSPSAPFRQHVVGSASWAPWGNYLSALLQLINEPALPHPASYAHLQMHVHHSYTVFTHKTE